MSTTETWHALVIESHDAAPEWGVSLEGPNPEPYHYLPCASQEQALALAECINAHPRCPRCGSDDVIPPAPRYRRFTCDPCGHDFSEDKP